MDDRQDTVTERLVMRSAPVRSLHRALGAIGVCGGALLVVEAALLPIGEPYSPLLFGLPLVVLVYLVAGLVAWRRRPSNPMGLLILIAGLCVYLSSLGNTGVPLLAAASAIVQTAIFAAVMHLLLAFPGGRLTSRGQQAIVVAGYTVAIVGQIPVYLLDRAGSFPPFAVVDAPELAAALGLVQSLAGGMLLGLVAWILLGRLRRAASAQRRVLLPVYGYGVFALLFIPLSSLVLEHGLGLDPLARGVLQFAVIAGVPIAFVLGLLRGGFARTGELAELAVWLGSRSRDEPLEQVLARALGDPSIELAFWSDERGGYVDASGAAVAVPPATAGEATGATGGRGWSEIVLERRPIGAIAYDAALIGDAEIVRTAGAVAAIEVERERLTAELIASRRALFRSRERLVDAADRERRRIARDLHDGLQVRLVMLGVEAQRLAVVEPAELGERATALRADIDRAAAELRGLVHDLVPAALIERGLVAAAEDLVDRMPVPTSLEGGLADVGLADAVENTAYFVIAEGLANVVKHANAEAASVRLERRGDRLRIVVADDGDGGAAIDRGTGLRGLLDRVEAVGGSLAIDSPRGAGTTLEAVVPCAS
ncbi:sensor histidine kinase [Agromyces soli]